MKLLLEHIFATLVILALAIGTATGIYWLLFDNAVPIISVSVKVMDETGQERNTFRRGEVLVVSREICSKQRTYTTLSRELANDKTVYLLPSGPYIMEAGCHTSINTSSIPNIIPPGHYTYRVIAQYQNNPITSGQLLLTVPELTVVP